MSVYAQEYGYFFNSSSSDRTYNAESFEKWLKPFFVSGVFTGGLEVVAQDTPDMTVNITAGYANLDGKLGFFPNDSTVSIAVASGVYDRIDTIVLRRDNVNRTVSIEVVTGVASVDPQPTPPTRDVDTYELVLAQILVGTGVTEIGQGDITDTRLDPDLCGYVCAAVQTPDFMDLYDQFTAQFQTWFDHMKDQLDEDAAGHLQLEIDDINDAMGVVPAGETLQGEIEQVDEDLGIVVNGNKTAHAGGAAIGQYIILRNSTITGCANGVYTAAKAIPYDTVIDSTYLTPCPDGGLNALNASLTFEDRSDRISIYNGRARSIEQKIYRKYSNGFVEIWIKGISENIGGSLQALLAVSGTNPEIAGIYTRGTGSCVPAVLDAGRTIDVPAGIPTSGGEEFTIYLTGYEL